MLIKQLKLIQYRSYARLTLSPCAGLNVLLGNNAEGKTNALESVFLSAFGRSHRTSRDQELIRRGEECAYVGLSLQTGAGPRKIEISLRQGEKKQIRLDGTQVSRMGELMGVCNAVLFSPEDLSLVKESPEVRRRFLDMQLSQLSSAYFYRLQQYNLALRQRNALLKEGAGARGPGLLAMWDEQLASLGALIMQERGRFLPELAAHAHAIHARISGGTEELTVKYAPNVPESDDAYSAILSRLERGAEDDLRRGFTGTGPHRDEIALTLCGVPARSFGSQGQQRTAALSLKLAVREILQEKTGESPILLLDDVLSELDDARQQALLGAATGCQVFLTCTSLAALRDHAPAEMRVFRVANGTAEEA